MKLTNRLQTVAHMIDKCNKIADIGTDHAYIPIYCIENGICNYALACDVRKGPLGIAAKNISSFNYNDKIFTRLSNGLEKIEKDEVDCIVIAGMGGLLINEILKKDLDNISDNTTIILQPMIAVYEVRKFLMDNGFVIVDEALADEDRKIYNIIKCKRGQEFSDEYQLHIGKKLIENNDKLLIKHMENKIYTVSKIVKGLETAGNKDEELLYYKKLLSYYERAKGELNV